MKRIIQVACFLIFLSACQAKTVSVPENIQEISQPMAENLFTSLENVDYESFHRDFTDKMLSATDEDTYTSIRDSITQIVGEYQSLAYDKSTYEEDYFISNYIVQFTKGTLTLSLVLETKEPYHIAGFWFPDFPTE
ncbi:MAG: DUF3887 domain-containing protein [Anaerolineaceae bacterium]